MPAAQWKLGRMYADGDGVDSPTTSARSNISAASPRPCRRLRARRRRASSPTRSWRSATSISRAFRIRRQAGSGRAHGMFRHAASYFGDPDGAVSARRACISTRCGPSKDPRAGGALAARWRPTRASTTRRRCSAPCCSRASDVPRQAAIGLFWLTVARVASGAGRDAGSPRLYDSAVQAGDRGRARARAHLS